MSENNNDVSSEEDDESLGEAFSSELRETAPEERKSVKADDEPGAKLGNAIAGAFGRFVGNMSLFTSRLVPGSAKMWRGLLQTSYKGIYKSKGSIDAIGHIIVGGNLKHVPLTYDHERGRYKTLADDPDWWETSSQYQDQYHVGPVPTVFASDAANDVGDHVQAEVAKALDLGNDAYLYQSADVNHVEMEIPEGSTPGEAVADGGNVQRQREEFVTVDNPGDLADHLVDLSTDADARVVSIDDYDETYPEKADSQKMKEERQLGRLMEKDDDMSAYAMKMLLIAGAIIVGTIAIVVLGPMVLGGGGGGGGSLIPITLGAMGLI